MSSSPNFEYLSGSRLSDLDTSKYGNVHRQLRALTILDGLIRNAGPRFQKSFADEPLLERLRVAATDTLSDDDVKKKCAVLFRQWAVSYGSTPGLERISSLYKQLPQRKKAPSKEQSKAVRETEAEAADVDAEQFGHSVSVSGGGQEQKSLRSPTTSSVPTQSASSSARSHRLAPTVPIYTKQKSEKNSRKSKQKPFVLEKEKPNILQVIASSSLASTNLMNTMKLINREHQRVSENTEAVKGFETCKKLRRQCLAYLQHIESGDLLGGLLHANDELVEALMAFEILDKSLEDDSDSEDDLDENGTSRAKQVGYERMAGLSLNDPSPAVKPPHPSFIPMPPANGKGRTLVEEEEDDLVEEDEDDPFADRNAAVTPAIERGGLVW